MAGILNWKIIKTRLETPDTRTFFLQPQQKGTEADYEAGQFLTLLLDQHGKDIRRSYSFSSAPETDPMPSITVKNIPNGEVSRLLFSKFMAGMEIFTLAPAGRFTLATSPGLRRDVFFIAAGNGIVPVFSLLKKLLNTEPLSHAILIYQVRDKKNMIFRKEMEALQNRYGQNFSFIPFYSAGDGHPPARLNPTLLDDILVKRTRFERDASLYYTCGPQAFMRMVEFALKVSGIPSERIRKETFHTDSSPVASLQIDPAPRHLTIRFLGTEYKLKIQYPSTILQCALDHSIYLPYSCRAGRCSSCIARCLSGNVLMSRNEVLMDEDLKRGLVLPCVGYATTDVELEYEMSNQPL